MHHSNSRVVFVPASQEKLFAGVDKLANLIRPTLGPLPRTVVNEAPLRTSVPEILDDGGTIARRVIQIGDPDENIGAMFLRNILRQLHETVGDGAATTAVLFQAILHTTRRLVGAGINPMDLRQQIEWATDRACEALHSQVQPLRGQDAIARCALVICHDAEMATLLGEIFYITDGDGYVRVLEWERRALDREYVEGSFWTGSWISPYMITNTKRQEAIMVDPAIFVSDLSLVTPEDVVPVMQAALSAGKDSLFMLVEDMSGPALSLLLANHQAGVLKALVVKCSAFDEKVDAVEDLGYLTGARPLRKAAGDAIRRVSATDLGTACRAWATVSDFGVAGGGGDPRALRRHIAVLRERLNTATSREEADSLRKRVGRLLGGVATLYVGGATEVEIKSRAAMARQTVTALHFAITNGVVPGGGSGLVRCAEVLRRTAGRPEMARGTEVLARALEEPLRVIATNAGYESSPVIEAVRAAPAYWGFDAGVGAVVDLQQAGILDPVTVLEAAIQTAGRSAALLLTTDVLVHPKRTRTTVKA
jgi:chaperonin GroEL